MHMHTHTYCSYMVNIVILSYTHACRHVCIHTHTHLPPVPTTPSHPQMKAYLTERRRQSLERVWRRNLTPSSRTLALTACLLRVVCRERMSTSSVRMKFLICVRRVVWGEEPPLRSRSHLNLRLLAISRFTSFQLEP